MPEAMAADLDANWEVLAEPIQSAMRALAAQGVAGMADPYERLKELTRGRRITRADLREFVRGLGLPAEVEARLLALTPGRTSGSPHRLVGAPGRAPDGHSRPTKRPRRVRRRPGPLGCRT